MNLYLLAMLPKVRQSMGYDEYDSKVVRAESEQQARLIANEIHGDEGGIWDNPKYTSCVILDGNWPAEQVIGSFNAG